MLPKFKLLLLFILRESFLRENTKLMKVNCKHGKTCEQTTRANSIEPTASVYVCFVKKCKIIYNDAVILIIKKIDKQANR